MKSIGTSLVPFNSPVFTIHVLRAMCTSVYFFVEFVRSTKLKGDIIRSHSMCFNENTALLITLEIRLTQHYQDSTLQFLFRSLKYFEQHLIETKY